uniref:Uncharacterized protein n=1 Tax=Knipowitschia caucasica TaxID=637954 RepID=A0AAV2JJN7_KNICA
MLSPVGILMSLLQQRSAPDVFAEGFIRGWIRTLADCVLVLTQEGTVRAAEMSTQLELQRKLCLLTVAFSSSPDHTTRRSSKAPGAEQRLSPRRPTSPRPLAAPTHQSPGRGGSVRSITADKGSD